MMNTRWWCGPIESVECRFLSPSRLLSEIRSIDTTQSVREEFNRLYDRVTATCARGEEVEEDLMAYREQQRMKIHDIQVSWAEFMGFSVGTWV